MSLSQFHRYHFNITAIRSIMHIFILLLLLLPQNIKVLKLSDRYRVSLYNVLCVCVQLHRVVPPWLIL